MKLKLAKDINRKTSIPKSEIRKAVEKVYGVKLDASKTKKARREQTSAS
jgi:ribosomal protein L23